MFRIAPWVVSSDKKVIGRVTTLYNNKSSTLYPSFSAHVFLEELYESVEGIIIEHPLQIGQAMIDTLISLESPFVRIKIHNDVLQKLQALRLHFVLLFNIHGVS